MRPWQGAAGARNGWQRRLGQAICGYDSRLHPASTFTWPPALPHTHTLAHPPTCSGGAQAVALLAANSAVRELLTRPLAIRHASLRRYIKSGASASPGTSGAATPGPRVHPQATAMSGTSLTTGLAARRGHDAALLPALSLEGDLSGDIVEAAALALGPEVAEAEAEAERSVSALQALATGIRSTLAF